MHTKDFIIACVICSGGKKNTCRVKRIKKKSNGEKNPLRLFVQPVMAL